MWGSSKGVLGGVGSLKGLRGFRVFWVSFKGSLKGSFRLWGFRAYDFGFKGLGASGHRFLKGV